MQPHVAQFLANNDSPSPAILKEVRDLLSQPLQNLRNKDIEIEHLNEALNDLEEERSAIQKSIDEYAAILSPIRRIPSDVLHEIFYQCLPTHRNPIMSITEAPLLLTRICQPWRSIALSSHRIWSKLHIALLPLSPSGYSQFPHPPGPDTTNPWEGQRDLVEKYTRTMRARCRLADIWLSRSGSCPLSISIKFVGGVDHVSADGLDDDNPLLQMFKSVLSFSHRFTDLELFMPYEIYDILQRRTSLNMVPRLRTLRMNLFRRSIRRGPQTVNKSVILLQAPSLQSISFYSRGFTAFDPRSIPSTWENLANLAFYSPITSAEAVQVLQRCQNLQHCRLIIANGVDVYISPDEVLSLPRMRSLSMHVGGTDSMALFYRRIDAPILASFDYQYYSRFPRSNSDDGQVSPPPSPFLPLLEKCNRIKKLSLDPYVLSPQDILFSFRFSNQLIHLVLGQRPYNAHGPQHNDEYYLGPGSFDLDILVTGDDPTLVSEQDVLLPKLEVFEAYLGVGFSDESLQRFILGRLGDTSRNEVSALRAVKVIFNRQRQIDIAEEVYQRARVAGIEIELDLRYLAEPIPRGDSKYTDVFSPWYGLAGSDRSWNFTDTDTDEF